MHIIFTYLFIYLSIYSVVFAVYSNMAIYSCNYTCVLKNVHFLFWTAVVRVCVCVCVCVWVGGVICYSPLLHNSILCNHKHSNVSNEKNLRIHFARFFRRLQNCMKHRGHARHSFTVELAAQLVDLFYKTESQEPSAVCNVEFGTLLYSHPKSYIPLLF